MLDKPLTRDDLVRFFGLQPVKTGDYRPLSRILSALGIRLVGGTTRWQVIWGALGLSPDQQLYHIADLTTPLLTAPAAAELVGVSSSIIYRWSKGAVPSHMPPFPRPIDLTSGRNGARGLRWRRAEVIAWHSHQPLPVYAQKAPAFASLAPGK